jgi:hypothetical protein
MHTPFPSAQWSVDGKPLQVVFAGQSLLFNIEAFIDGASNTVVPWTVARACALHWMQGRDSVRVQN